MYIPNNDSLIDVQMGGISHTLSISHTCRSIISLQVFFLVPCVSIASMLSNSTDKDRALVSRLQIETLKGKIQQYVQSLTGGYQGSRMQKARYMYENTIRSNFIELSANINLNQLSFIHFFSTCKACEMWHCTQHRKRNRTIRVHKIRRIECDAKVIIRLKT